MCTVELFCWFGAFVEHLEDLEEIKETKRVNITCKSGCLWCWRLNSGLAGVGKRLWQSCSPASSLCVWQGVGRVCMWRSEGNFSRISSFCFEAESLFLSLQSTGTRASGWFSSVSFSHLAVGLLGLQLSANFLWLFMWAPGIKLRSVRLSWGVHAFTCWVIS